MCSSARLSKCSQKSIKNLDGLLPPPFGPNKGQEAQTEAIFDDLTSLLPKKCKQALLCTDHLQCFLYLPFLCVNPYLSLRMDPLGDSVGGACAS